MLHHFPKVDEPEPEMAAAAQADWVMYLSADYADSPHDKPEIRRPQMLTPKMVAIAVESPTAETILTVSKVLRIPCCSTR